MKTKKTDAVRPLLSPDIPLSELIGDRLFKRVADLSRVQLVANGAPQKRVDKLSDSEAAFWAQEQMRQFCGMGPSAQYLEAFGWKKRRKTKTPTSSNKNVNSKTTRPKKSQ